MSQAALAALREGNSLAHTLTFEQLEEYHVPFDQLCGGQSVEQQVTYWSACRGRVALIGDSGAGKSSVLASVFGALSDGLPDGLVPTRIPVDLAGRSAITEVGDFGRHVVKHILDWAAPEALDDQERTAIERQLATMEHRTGRQRRAGFSLGSGSLLPVDLRFSGDLTGAAADFRAQLDHGDVVRALKRLVALFRARGLEPFFVFDDTDAWLQLPGQESTARELATGFFANNVRMLTREIDCGFALAVHRSYLELPAYQQVVGSLEPIEIPVFPDPAAAIQTILGRRIEIDQLDIELGDAFDAEAIAALAAAYADVPDLRKVMAIAGLAVRKVHDDREATIVTEPAVIAADPSATRCAVISAGLAWLQHDHLRFAFQLRVVVVEAGVLDVVLAPEVGALLALGDARPDLDPPAPDLDLGLGVGRQVQRPGGDLFAAGVGVDHDQLLAIGEVDDRGGPLLARFAPGRRQQQHRGPVDLAHHPPAGRPVDRDIELARPAQAGGTQGVGESRVEVVARHGPSIPRGGRVVGMPEPHPFRRAAEAKDLELLTETLREDVVLHSPILFRGFAGRDLVSLVLAQVAATLEDLTYTDELVEGDTVALRFKASVGDRELEGIDFLELDADGKVVELTVFMRPLSALTAFNEQMKTRLEAAQP